MDLSIVTVFPEKDEALVEVAGEVDISCASDLREELDRALEMGARSVVLDIAEMSYIDSTGIGVLVGFAKRAEEAGCAFTLRSPLKNVRRVFGLLGVLEQLGLEPRA